MSDEAIDGVEVAAEEDGPIEVEAPPGLDEQAQARREAALAQVVKFGDPVLRSAASPVSEFDAALQADAERMVAIMRDGIGVGLAATQLGILRRMLVFQAGPEAPADRPRQSRDRVASEQDLVTAEEGCLSLPGVIVDVERPLFVRVRALDAAGESLSIEASGLEARVIQHEIDHLDGVLIARPRQSAPQRKGALRALREGGTYSPPRPEAEEPAARSEGEPTPAFEDRPE